MKIVVKTLKGTRFEIQVNPNDSVADVKKKIETVMGASEYPAAGQTLIHKGKVLRDETTMEANNVAEKSSIAIMKRKPASAGSSTASVRLNSQVQTQEAADPKGFYYFPEGLSNDGSLEFLRHTQQYRVLRPLVQSNRRMLKVIVDAMKKKNPPLYQMIIKNKAGFISLLMDEPFEGGAGGNQMAQPQEQLQDHQDEFFNHISPEEYESIQRLEAMGFEESLVLEVFLACNKNEELATKYLLDHNH